MSLFTISSPVAKKQGYKEIFGSLEEEHKYHIVDWKTLFTPPREGASMIRRLDLQSSPFKWLWKYAFEWYWYWRMVATAKYSSQGVWSLMVLNTSLKKGLWMVIVSAWMICVGIRLFTGYGWRMGICNHQGPHVTWSALLFLFI